MLIEFLKLLWHRTMIGDYKGFEECRMRIWVKYVVRRVKWGWQKISRGYSDCDLWYLRGVFGDFILPRLRAFREMKRMGVCPGSMCPESKPVTTTSEEYEKKMIKQWNDTLDKMIFAFEYMKKDDEGKNLTESYEEDFKNWDKVQEGLELFAKYYLDLWD